MKKGNFLEACSKAEDATTHVKELTYGGNGYPEFGGKSRLAYFGFDNFEEAEALVKELGCGEIEKIHWRDGWQLAESKGWENKPMRISAESYGDDYLIWELSEELSVLKERISEADDFEAIQELVSDFEELKDEYDTKDDDEIIVTHEGRHFETIREHVMGWTFDTHNYAIAVVIDSSSECLKVEEE